jgi:sugar phosphate isomerase/epimerase
MRFGVCTNIASASVVAQSGYDYIELAVASDLVPESDESAWAAKRHEIETMPLVPEVFNSFIRIGKIVGPAVDSERLRRYVSTALSRAAQVGGSIIVFGSGGARSIPEGWPGEEAHRQLIDFLNLCADAYEVSGVIVVVEPLCRAECNIINLVSEGAALAREVSRAGVKNLADTYHMDAASESLEVLIQSADVLAHVHTADMCRLWPGSGSYDHTELFRVLRRANYDKTLSIECTWQDKFEEHVGAALAHLKQAYAREIASST